MKTLIAALLFSTTGLATTPKSNHIDGFRLQQCLDGRCLSAEGARVFVSMDGALFSGSKISFRPPGEGRDVLCESFRYDLKAQFLSCEMETGEALVIERDFTTRHHSVTSSSL